MEAFEYAVLAVDSADEALLHALEASDKASLAFDRAELALLLALLIVFLTSVLNILNVTAPTRLILSALIVVVVAVWLIYDMILSPFSKLLAANNVFPCVVLIHPAVSISFLILSTLVEIPVICPACTDKSDSSFTFTWFVAVSV